MARKPPAPAASPLRRPPLPGRPSGRGRNCCRRESASAAPPSRRASGRPAAIASASHAATSSPAIAMRTMPCTPISAKRAASLRHRSSGATASPFTTLSTSLDDLDDRRCRGRQIAEQISAAGDTLFGQKIDQQQRRRGDALAAGAERVGHRHLDGGRPHDADGKSRRRCVMSLFAARSRRARLHAAPAHRRPRD